jgi:hypothetical protein
MPFKIGNKMTEQVYNMNATSENKISLLKYRVSLK